MLIRVKKQVFEMPPPAAGEGETVIQVDRYAPIRVPAGARAHRFAFENQVAKLWFFFLHEGLKLTLNKVRAAFLQRAIAGERQVVFAVGTRDDGGGMVVAVGPQDCPDSEVQRFPSDLVLSLADAHEAEPLYARVHGYLTAHPDRLAALFHHMAFSGRPLGMRFADIAAQPAGDGTTGEALEPLRAIAIGGAEPRAAVDAPAARNEIFLVGTGAYACAYVLPILSRRTFHTAVDLNPALVAVVAERFRFRHRDTSVDRAFERLSGAAEPIVVLAGYHSTHADHAAKAIAANPGARVMIEKPPALTVAEAENLVALRRDGAHIEIGYNRRFAPMTVVARRVIGAAEGPVCVTCIVKELLIPESHWYRWPTQGTRIFGNLAHWVDIGVCMIDAEPLSLVIASAANSKPGDELSMTVVFADGSRLTVVATEHGNGLRGVQEYIDIRRANVTVQIDDFLRMTTERGGRRRIRRWRIRDKGHLAMYRAFLDGIEKGQPPSYPDRALLTTTRILAAAVDTVMRHRFGSVIPLNGR
jgi:predicted dehydrogenase